MVDTGEVGRSNAYALQQLRQLRAPCNYVPCSPSPPPSFSSPAVLAYPVGDQHDSALNLQYNFHRLQGLVGYRV